MLTYTQREELKPFFMFGTRPKRVHAKDLRSLVGELVIGIDIPARMISSTFTAFIFNRVTNEYTVCAWSKNKYYVGLLSRVPSVVLYEESSEYGDLEAFRRERWQESRAGKAWMARELTKVECELWKKPRMYDGDETGIWTPARFPVEEVRELVSKLEVV